MPLRTVHSATGTLNFCAAACSSIARAVAPARRMGSQASRTLVDPPVAITPRASPILYWVTRAIAASQPASSGRKGTPSPSIVALA